MYAGQYLFSGPGVGGTPSWDEWPCPFPVSSSPDVPTRLGTRVPASHGAAAGEVSVDLKHFQVVGKKAGEMPHDTPECPVSTRLTGVAPPPVSLRLQHRRVGPGTADGLPCPGPPYETAVRTTSLVPASRPQTARHVQCCMGTPASHPHLARRGPGPRAQPAGAGLWQWGHRGAELPLAGGGAHGAHHLGEGRRGPDALGPRSGGAAAATGAQRLPRGRRGLQLPPAPLPAGPVPLQRARDR